MEGLKNKETGDIKHIYKSIATKKLGLLMMLPMLMIKNCLKKRLDKNLNDKVYVSISNPRYDECQKRLASMIYKFFFF